MYIQGVNLGNWLVLEKWMSPGLFEGTTADDEYYLPRQLPKEIYEARIKTHRNEYITERDFATIQSMGFNSVRIPVPYFIFGDCEPFIGCVNELDKAFAWAGKYELSILIDLHTVPGSQNGFDNGGLSGVCKWSQQPDSIEFTLNVLERLAKRYGKRNELWGIEIINEPITENMWKLMDVPNRYNPVNKEMAEGSRPNTLEFLRDFYIRAYRVLRPHMKEESFIVFHDGFEIKAWKDFMREEEFKNVVLDTHQYLMFAEGMGCKQDVNAYVQYIEENYANDIKEMQEYFPVICGEWSLFNSYACGTDTAGGQSPLNGVESNISKLTNEDKQNVYIVIAKAQLDAWKNGIGHYYWNYKLLLDTVNDPGWIGWDSWDLGKCVALGWYPLGY